MTKEDLEEGVLIPSKEEIFGKVNEITTHYQDINEKMINQMKNKQVVITPTLILINIF